MWVRSTGGTAVGGTGAAVGGVLRVMTAGSIADGVVAVRPMSFGSPDIGSAVSVLVLSSEISAGDRERSSAGVSYLPGLGFARFWLSVLGPLAG